MTNPAIRIAEMRPNSIEIIRADLQLLQFAPHRPAACCCGIRRSDRVSLAFSGETHAIEAGLCPPPARGEIHRAVRSEGKVRHVQWPAHDEGLERSAITRSLRL